jgi:hypothetical protein
MRRVNYTVGNATLGVKARRVLVPDGADADEQLAKLAAGERVGVEITRPRSPKFNAMVHLAIERLAVAMHITVRGCYGWLLIRTGHINIVLWPPGTRPVIVPHAVSDMDAVTFETFWESACTIIRADVLPHLDAADVADIAPRLADEG